MIRCLCVQKVDVRWPLNRCLDRPKSVSAMCPAVRKARRRGSFRGAMVGVVTVKGWLDDMVCMRLDDERPCRAIAPPRSARCVIAHKCFLTCLCCP
jgi:hypothetical protein